MVIAILFAIACVLTRFIPDRAFVATASWLASRGLFRAEPAGDERIINLVRMMVGLVLLFRYGWVGEFLFPLSPPSYQVFDFTVLMACSACLLVGFLTPLVSLLLLLMQWQLNKELGTYTLGIDVTDMLLVTFVLYPAGRVLSVDAWLARHFRGMSALYRCFLFTDRRTQQAWAKFLSFTSYALLCMFSVLLHLKEPFWTTGEAAIELLSSTYLSQLAPLFASLFSHSPLAVALAKLSMQGMICWYFLLFPCVLIGGLLRWAVLGWMFCFFFLSTFVLQLSLLPYIEWALMIVWFWDLVVRHEHHVYVLYDDTCNLCDGTVRFLRAIDMLKTIRFLPLSKNLDRAKRIGASPEEVYQDIFSWDEDEKTIRKGYDFYLHLSIALPLLWPFYPLLLVFRLCGIGPLVYRYIAKRRTQLFGVCKLPTNMQAKAPTNPLVRATPVKFALFRPFVVTWVLFALFFIPALPGGPLYRSPQKTVHSILIAAYTLGIAPIDVFNHTDLNMSYHFFTVTRVDPDGQETLVPFTAADGSRLAFHRSDRAYFGNSLVHRRLKNIQPMLPPTDTDMRLFREIVTWAEYFSGKPKATYRFDFYTVKPPEQQGDTYEFFQPTKLGTLSLKGE